jgi:putative transposase
MQNQSAPVGRKVLPHDPPLWINPSAEIYFITICAKHRGDALLSSAPDILASARFQEEHQKWFLLLFLVMPDHIHALLRFPPEAVIRETIRGWKRWTNRQLGIAWQDGYFDHRLRRDESLKEKARYILQNPVRAGLVSAPEEWPHIHLGEDHLRLAR